jgi:hypothetical protein
MWHKCERLKMDAKLCGESDEQELGVYGRKLLVSMLDKRAVRVWIGFGRL